MTRAQYLAELSTRLAKLPAEERDSAMRFYVEYFDEAGEGNEQQVIDQLGQPRLIAEQLLGESARDFVARPVKLPQKRGAGTWILIVLGSPIWLPLAFAGLMVVLSLALMVLCLLLCLALLAVCPLLVSGAMLLGGGFSALCGIAVGLTSIPTAMWFTGMGLVVLALGALLLRPCLTVMQRALQMIFRTSNWMMRKLRRLRRGAGRAEQ